MRLRILAQLIFLALIVPGSAWGINVIVNADNPVSSVSPSELSNYYFKRSKSWPDGTPVRFIDRQAGSATRNDFFRSFLHKTPKEIELFWIGQKLYSGNSAPMQEPSDESVIQFVAAFKGAIGYISDGTPVSSKNVKIIKVR